MILYLGNISEKKFFSQIGVPSRVASSVWRSFLLSISTKLFGTKPVWAKLWKLKVSAKIKIFYWRTLYGLIPLKSVLVNQHIGTSGQCPLCTLDAEDVSHLLFQCSAARDL
jgi:hypothetical protein